MANLIKDNINLKYEQTLETIESYTYYANYIVGNIYDNEVVNDIDYDKLIAVFTGFYICNKLDRFSIKEQDKILNRKDKFFITDNNIDRMITRHNLELKKRSENEKKGILIDFVDDTIEYDPIPTPGGVETNNIVDFALIEEYKDELALLVSNKKDNKYYIGNIPYDNPGSVITVIRNKIAHGDYLINNNIITIQDKNQIGTFTTEQLYSLCASLDNDLDKNMLIEPRERILCIHKGSICLTMEEYYKNNSVLKITDTPIGTFRRTKEYRDDLSDLYSKILNKYNKDFKYESTPEKKKIFQNELNVILNDFRKKYNGKAKLEVDLIKMCNLPYFDTFKEKIDEYGIKEYRHKNYAFSSCVTQLILKLSKGKYQSYSYSKGLFLNLEMLSKYKERKYKNIQEFRDYNTESTFYHRMYFGDMLVSCRLSGFCAMFQVGLDNDLTNYKKISYEKIKNGELIDLGELSLFELINPNMKVKNKFDDSIDNNQLISLYKQYRASLNKLQNAINGAKSKNKELSIETYNKLNTEYLEIKTRIQEKLLELNRLELEKQEYIKSGKRKEFNRNLFLMKKLRDAASHDGIFLDEYNSEQKTIIVVDPGSNQRDNSCEVSYKKVITPEQYNDLFSWYNFNKVYAYYYDHCDQNNPKREKFAKRIYESIIINLDEEDNNEIKR